MKKFLLCIVPAFLCILTAVVLTYGKTGRSADTAISICMVLLVIGAVGSGICVGNSIFVKSTLNKGWKITVSILCGVLVAFGYAVFLFGGCCAIVTTLS